MLAAVTGHRPDKIGGYDYWAPQRVWIREMLLGTLETLRPEKTISGMALGVDQDFAQVCIDMGLPFIAALPFLDQEITWPPSSRKYFDWLLERADSVVVVSPGSYSPAKMQVRNQWMVDHCNTLIAVWDGTEGGTGNCVRYAEPRRPIYRIDPRGFR